MRLPKLAMEYHQFTIVVIILLIGSGLVSFFTMPRSEDPRISPAGSNIVVIYPGASPSDMEELIVDRIEDVINELEDIKELKSTSEDGLALIEVEFLTGSDPDDKYSDVVQKVNSIRNTLPRDILSLDIIKWTISNVSILQLAIVSDSSAYSAMEKEAEHLKDELEKVSGVRKVKTWAYPEQEIRVSIDLPRISQYKIPLQQVIGAVQSANQNIPGGNIELGSRKYNIQTSGSYQALDDIRNTIVRSDNGHIIYLKDIAKVSHSYEDTKYHARFRGKRCVFLTVSQKEGTNIFQIREQLSSVIDAFKKELPETQNLEFVFDQSESVSARINRFFMNLLQGLLLVGLVVFIAVGLQASSIVLMVIPISILIAIGFVDLSDYGFQQMSITGMVIALGLLVDNAIVVTENISRFMRLGYKPIDAADKGTAQIGSAVVSSTVTTILAFLPIIMMQNVTGEFIRSMPVTVIYILLASLFISLTLTPYLSSKFIKPQNERDRSRIQKLLDNFISKHYRNVLLRSINRPVSVIAIAVITFILSLAIFPFVGVSFFPKAEKPQFMVNINTPEGFSLEKTNAVAIDVEAELDNYQEIKHYATNVGHGNPRIYYNVWPKNETSTHAQIFVELKNNNLKTFQRIITMLREKFGEYPAAKIEVKEFEQGPPVEAPIAVRVLGENLDILKEISLDVEKMISGTPGTINVNNPLATSKTDLHVKINRDKAGIFGVALTEIDRTVRAGIAGLTMSIYRDKNGKEYNIVLRLPLKEKADISHFDKIYVASRNSMQIPLKELASIEFMATPMQINHYGMSRNVTITADVVSRVSVDEATRQIINQLDDYDFPKGYQYAIGGELESREESFGGMAKAILIAVIAIFSVLVLQFRSYTQPIIVFSAIPLAIIGSILALLITGYSFSFTAFVGLTSLVGIVVNNSIILVDYTNQLRRKGKAVAEAIQEACEVRFRPVVLTTATTIGGLLPLTLAGGTMWAPMGWTIIGGLIVSTMLTLILVPVLYNIFTRTEV